MSTVVSSYYCYSSALRVSIKVLLQVFSLYINYEAIRFVSKGEYLDLHTIDVCLEGLEVTETTQGTMSRGIHGI